MKIIGKNNEVLNSITLCLTSAEAKELTDSATDLVEHPSNHHHHISSSDFQTEITIAVYNSENLGDFDQDLQRIICDEPEAD